MLACAAAIAAAPGCGETEQEQVRDATDAYISAVAKGDYAAACELFTAAYLKELEGPVGCRRAQADQFGGPAGASASLEIASVRVKGDRANVTVNVSRGAGSPSPLTLLMVLQDEEWLIRGQQ